MKRERGSRGRQNIDSCEAKGRDGGSQASKSVGKHKIGGGGRREVGRGQEHIRHGPEGRGGRSEALANGRALSSRQQGSG